MTPELAKIKACVFDVFGTVVDWRTSIIAECMELGSARGLNRNWAEFADRWRLGYRPAMDKVRRGEVPWTNLDGLERMILDQLLSDFKIEGLSEEEKLYWSHAWRRLRPWPDSVEGLARLKTKYIVAPLSNGNLALLTHLAKFARLPWDVILGSDLARHYKPDPEMYLAAAFYLDLKPHELMMCAAHGSDLQAACACGLRTAFIDRPHEFAGEFGVGAAGRPDQAAPGEFDVVSASITDLAAQMGV